MVVSVATREDAFNLLSGCCCSPQIGQNPAQTSFVSFVAGPASTPAVNWTFPTGGSSVAVGFNASFVVSTDGMVFSLDDNGTPNWSAKLGDNTDRLGWRQ